jgi:mono/diheme cytochrome c family protein
VTLSVSTLAVRCLAIALLSLMAVRAGADDSPSISKPAAVDAGGAQIYTHICQGCHMPQAQGAVGAGRYPKLAGDPALVSWQYVALTVLRGRNGMPSFGLPADGGRDGFGSVQLTDEQIADVVNYVRSHFGNTYKDRVSAAQIEKLPHPGVDVTR